MPKINTNPFSDNFDEKNAKLNIKVYLIMILIVSILILINLIKLTITNQEILAFSMLALGLSAIVLLFSIIDVEKTSINLHRLYKEVLHLKSEVEKLKEMSK